MSTSTGGNGPDAERAEKLRRSKLEGIRRQVRSGKLVVRQMTDEERAESAGRQVEEGAPWKTS
jgi:hypothetical protein